MSYTAVITGGSKGIGADIAQALLEREYTVVSVAGTTLIYATQICIPIAQIYWTRMLFLKWPRRLQMTTR